MLSTIACPVPPHTDSKLGFENFVTHIVLICAACFLYDVCLPVSLLLPAVRCASYRHPSPVCI